MAWDEESFYNLAQAIVQVDVVKMQPYGAAIAAVFTFINKAIEKEKPTVDEALDEFEVKIKDWVNKRIEEELQDFEADQLMITYRGLRRRFADWEHDLKKLGNRLTPEQKAELKSRLVDLADSFSQAMPRLTATQAYQLEVLPIFPIWVTFHMSVLKELERQDPDHIDSIDEQYRMKSCLKEYLKAAYILSARILRKFYDPGRIERTEKITRRGMSHDVQWNATLSWEDKGKNKKWSTPRDDREWWESEKPNWLNELRMRRERSIQEYLMGGFKTWDHGVGVIIGLNEYKKLTSEDDTYWADVELLRKWSTLSGTLTTTKTYGGGGGDKVFYLFPAFANARLVKLECWYNNDNYVNGLCLTWEDGTSQSVEAHIVGPDTKVINLGGVREIEEISLHCGPPSGGVIDSMSFRINGEDVKVGGGGGHEKKNIFIENKFVNARLIGVAGKAGNSIDSIQFIVEKPVYVDTSFPG